MRKLLVLISLLALSTPLTYTHAQFAGTLQDLVGDFSLSASPQFPTPNQKVTVTVQNFSLDLMTATETWRVNGKNVASGRGVTEIDVATGGQGARTIVSVTVDTPDQSYTRSLIIEPAAVDLMWQGNTYTPPFYPGLARWGEGSSVTLLAVPHIGSPGGELNPKNLIYKWSVNDEIQGSQSGTGRNTLTLNDNALSTPQKIFVQVLTSQTSEVAEGEITVSPFVPDLVVYEDNPLYGIIFGHAISDTVSIKDSEVTFTALPLLLNVKRRTDPSLHYSWNVNGSVDGQYGNKITYRAPAGPGTSQVTTEMTHKGTYTQTASTNFLVQFNNQNGI